MAESGRLDVWLSFGLAFVGGYGDAASFVLAKTSTGHVTGNLVLGAIAVAADDRRAMLGHLSAIVTFLTGVLMLVELHSLATAKNGMRFDNRYCWVVYFRNNVIVRVRAYLDSAMVARLFEENPIG
jgi:uncharacterized membrane protein YoaK (UPF0700 family)